MTIIWNSAIIKTESEVKKMENKIKNAIDKLENIVNYHNKNLTKKQYFDLVEVLETMKEIKNNESEELKMEEIKKVKYDFVVIYRDNENLEEMKELIMQKIKDYNYEINEIETWGSKLLAYPIKKENKGYFVLYNLVDSEEDTKIKASEFAKEIEKLQYEEDKTLKSVILKFVLVRL